MVRIRIHAFLPAVQTGCASCWAGTPPPLLYPVDRKSRCSELWCRHHQSLAVCLRGQADRRTGGQHTESSCVLSMFPVIRELISLVSCFTVIPSLMCARLVPW